MGEGRGDGGGRGGGLTASESTRVLIFTSNNRIRVFFQWDILGLVTFRTIRLFLVRAQPNTAFCASNSVTSFAYPCH